MRERDQAVAALQHIREASEINDARHDATLAATVEAALRAVQAARARALLRRVIDSWHSHVEKATMLRNMRALSLRACSRAAAGSAPHSDSSAAPVQTPAVVGGGEAREAREAPDDRGEGGTGSVEGDGGGYDGMTGMDGAAAEAAVAAAAPLVDALFSHSPGTLFDPVRLRDEVLGPAPSSLATSSHAAAAAAASTAPTAATAEPPSPQPPSPPEPAEAEKVARRIAAHLSSPPPPPEPPPPPPAADTGGGAGRGADTDGTIGGMNQMRNRNPV